MNLGRRLSESGYTVKIAALDCTLREQTRLSRTGIVVRTGGISAIDIPVVRALSRVISVPSLRGMVRLLMLIRWADLVIASPFYVEDLILWSVTKLSQKPLFLSQNNAFIHNVRGNPREKLQDLWNRHIESILLKSANGVRAVGSDQGKDLEDHGVARLIVTYPSYVSENLKPHPSVSDIPPEKGHADRNLDKLRVLVAGRMTLQKGTKTLEDILKLMERSDRMRSQIELTFVGTDLLPEPLSRMCERYPETIRSLGFVQGGIEAPLSKMDVLLVPSLYEGIATTAITAIAQGVPVIGSDIPGVREVVDHGFTGWLCKPGNELEFLRALENCVKLKRESLDTWMTIKLRCRTKYLEQFGPEVCANQYNELLRAIEGTFKPAGTQGQMTSAAPSSP